jgi:hypothetical protein
LRCKKLVRNKNFKYSVKKINAGYFLMSKNSFAYKVGISRSIIATKNRSNKLENITYKLIE